MTDQKEQWKKDSEQLKEDMNNRKKIVKKREVQIKVGKTGRQHVPIKNNVPPPGGMSSPFTDEQRRRELGLL
ncbi:hypothetical protein HOG98_03080 [bacterium]|jgi:hypothetical protein|nr:hypothetical protein [bacterium]